MEHFTPASSDLVRLRAQILINVVFLLFLRVKADVDDETLMSLADGCFASVHLCHTTLRRSPWPAAKEAHQRTSTMLF